MKTTNPSLIKRYFKGELKVGDHSKDFIVEPQYCLVFTGKIPYRNSANLICAWKYPNGNFYHKESYPSAVAKLLDQRIPDCSKAVFYEGSRISQFCGTAIMLSNLGKGREGEAKDLINRMNNLYTEIQNKEMLWKFVAGRQVWSKLFNSPNDTDFSEAHPEIQAEVMMRRLDE